MGHLKKSLICSFVLVAVANAFWPFTEDESKRPVKSFEGDSPLDRKEKNRIARMA